MWWADTIVPVVGFWEELQAPALIFLQIKQWSLCWKLGNRQKYLWTISKEMLLSVNYICNIYIDVHVRAIETMVIRYYINMVFKVRVLRHFLFCKCWYILYHLEPIVQSGKMNLCWCQSVTLKQSTLHPIVHLAIFQLCNTSMHTELFQMVTLTSGP